jgi:RNA polymerase sigma factor FliA
MDPPEVIERVDAGLALVDRIVRRFVRSRDCAVESEDLIGYARVGLLAAARGFDPKRGPSFVAYATFRIRGAIWDAARTEAAMGVARIVAALGVELEGTGREAGELVLGSDPEQEVSNAQLVALVLRWLPCLPDQEAALLRRHYFEGESLERIAQDFGISKSWASRLHGRAVARLGKQLRRAG